MDLDLYDSIVYIYEAHIRTHYTKCDNCQSRKIGYNTQVNYSKNIITNVQCLDCGVKTFHELIYKVNHSTIANILPKCMKLYPKFESCLKCLSHNVVDMTKLDGSDCMDCGFSSFLDPNDLRGVLRSDSNNTIKYMLCPQCNVSYSLNKHLYDSNKVRLECYDCKFVFIYDLNIPSAL